MRFILLIVCALCVFSGAKAQNIDFDHKSWDFDVIEESDGVVRHTFRFKNSGEKPLVIYNIRSSCGCTTSEYSTQPIIAGDSSSIVVSYDPTNRPGAFMRDVYIYSTASKSPIQVRITGWVNPRTLSVEQRYPHAAGDKVRVSDTHLSVGTIKREWLASAKLELLNVGAEDVKVELRPRTPRTYLNVGFAQSLEPREGAVMEVGYMVENGTTVAKSDDGRLVDTLDLYVDGLKTDRWLRISGILTK